MEKGGSVTVNNRKALKSCSTPPRQSEEALSAFPRTTARAAVALRLFKDYALPVPELFATSHGLVTQTIPSAYTVSV